MSETIGFWSTTLDHKHVNDNTIPTTVHDVYEFGLLDEPVFCNICHKFTISFKHKCNANKSKTNWLSKLNLKVSCERFFRIFLLKRPPLYKICEKGNKNYNFHSKSCLNHITRPNSRVKEYMCMDYVLYEKIPIPRDFTYKMFTERKKLHVIEAYLSTCNHKVSKNKV